MPALRLYQIYYDDASRARLDPGFIPLDNTRNARPDWFEFHVILQYFRQHGIDDDTWYGFFSPRLHEKTGLRAHDVIAMIRPLAEEAEVALFSPHRDQVAFFLNVFEQGDAAHPGLMDLSTQFLRALGSSLDLRQLVMDSSRGVFGNYLVARHRFWMAWWDLAERFWDFVEHQPDIDPRFHGATRYGADGAPFKTFIQERLASLVLSTDGWRTIVPAMGDWSRISTQLFTDTPLLRRQLEACDFMKSRHLATGDPEFLSVYWKLRRDIARGALEVR